MPTVAAFLRPYTPVPHEDAGEDIEISDFPFRVGRESRAVVINGEILTLERRNKSISKPNNDYYLLDTGRKLNISREHFQIEKHDGGYRLVDRGSTCGTIVNGQVVGGHHEGGICPLEDGDIIVVGTSSSPFKFRFLVPEP